MNKKAERIVWEDLSLLVDYHGNRTELVSNPILDNIQGLKKF